MNELILILVITLFIFVSIGWYQIAKQRKDIKKMSKKDIENYFKNLKS